MMLTFFEFSVYLNGDENISIDNSPLIDLTGIEPTPKASVNDLVIGPNPSSDVMISSFHLGKSGTWTLQACNLLGEVVKTFFDHRTFDGGDYQYQYSVSGIAPGCYLITLSNGTERIVKKLLVSGK
jgi:hypothetical protein